MMSTSSDDGHWTNDFCSLPPKVWRLAREWVVLGKAAVLAGQIEVQHMHIYMIFITDNTYRIDFPLYKNELQIRFFRQYVFKCSSIMTGHSFWFWEHDREHVSALREHYACEVYTRASHWANMQGDSRLGHLADFFPRKHINGVGEHILYFINLSGVELGPSLLQRWETKHSN